MAGYDVLAALRSPRNLTPSGNGYMDKRRNQMASGDDTLAPTDLEQLQAQNAEGVGSFTSPGGMTNATVSRDMLRDSGIAALKRKLAMDDEAEQSALAGKLAIGRQTGEYGLRGEEIKGRYGVQAATEGAKAGMDRLLASQHEQDQRMADQITSREKLAGQAQTGMNDRAANAVPYQLQKDLSTAKARYNGTFSNFSRKFLGGAGSGSQEYENALTNVLRRSGSLDMITKAAQQTIAEGKSADQALAEAEAAGVTLDPDEQDALRLFVDKMQGGR